MSYESLDWSFRGKYMFDKHGVSAFLAAEATADPDRVLLEPDYNSASGESVRIIGYSPSSGEVLSIIAMSLNGREIGINGWLANEKDRRIYGERSGNE
jgi:hypothetical protein